jgi:hypothetical protein
MDIPGTLAYYQDKLGFKCLGTWEDPPVYVIVGRDQHAIHFRCAVRRQLVNGLGWSHRPWITLPGDVLWYGVCRYEANV